MVCLSSAEKAERTKNGMCWYCPEKWVVGHVCKRNFLAYMGVEEKDDKDTLPHDDQPYSEIIAADLSHIYALGGRQRTDSIELMGEVGHTQVWILVDTGSSHDFLHPRIAEQLSLSLKEIRPFRVYVGNVESLLCSYASLRIELTIQGVQFTMDFHILLVHGPDIILGIVWLRSLHKVITDYDEGTIKFLRDGQPVCLKVVPPPLLEVSMRTFASIMFHHGGAEVFEIVLISESPTAVEETSSFPADLPLEVL